MLLLLPNETESIAHLKREQGLRTWGQRRKKTAFFGGGGVASKSQAVHRMLNGHIRVVKKTGNNALHLTENL